MRDKIWDGIWVEIWDGIRDGSVERNLAKMFKGKRFSKKKTVKSKTPEATRLNAAPRLMPLVLYSGEGRENLHLKLRICCNLTISIHHVNSLQLLIGHLCTNLTLNIGKKGLLNILESNPGTVQAT